MTKKIVAVVKRGRPVDPKSVRSKVRDAFETFGIEATSEQVKNYVLKRSGGKIKAKDLKTLPVQVSQIRKDLLKKAGIRITRKVGRPTLANQAKMVERYTSAA